MPNRFVSRPVVRATVPLALACLAACLAACQGTPPLRTVEPELTLLETSPLVVPKDCFASGSFAVTFTVATSGRIQNIRASDAPTCVQQALTAWVASFRYAPPNKATPATMEWMMVTAQRGS